MKNQERNLERKFSKGGSSSSKRTRESQVDSIHGSATRGRREGPTMTESCQRLIGGCLRSGSTDRLIVNCLRGFGSFRNPQGSS